MKFRIMAGAAAGALSLGLVAGAPAAAQPNTVDQDGLVNLALQDTTIQVPIGIAANICGVGANVIASQTVVGPVDCTAEGVATAERSDNGGPNNARQRGLVNVAIQDTTVQVPVAVAANVCGISVNLIAAQTIVGPTTCEALAEADATA